MDLLQYKNLNNINNSNNIGNNSYMKENEAEIKIRHLTKENSDLLEINKNLEERLKQLEQYISSNQVQTNNANIYNINLNNNTNNSLPIKNQRKKTPTSAVVRTNKSNISNASSNKAKFSNKGKNSNLKNNSSSKNLRNNRNNNSLYISTKITNKSIKTNQSKILPSTILKNKKGIEIKNERERDEYNIKILNEMINEKNKELQSLEYELKLQNMAKKGEGYLDYELNLWQKKVNTLSTLFYQKFNSIKSEAYLDKNEFQNLIHNMKKICEKNQSYEENICEDIINKQTWFINNLENKNNDIKKKLEKMKNIFK